MQIKKDLLVQALTSSLLHAFRALGEAYALCDYTCNFRIM